MAANSDFGIAKKVLQVSLPLMGSMLGSLLMMFVDRVCLARYSDNALAASGPAIYTATAIIGFFTALVGFSRSCVAQAFGRHGKKAAAYHGAIGIIIAFVLAISLVMMAPLIEKIPFFSGRSDAITKLESQFLYWSAYFGAAMTFNMSISSYFNAIGKTRITLLVGLVGQVVQMVMTVGLVFGKFGLPELGMRGSAIGTMFGSISVTACYLLCTPSDIWSNILALISRRKVFAQNDTLQRLKNGAAIGLAACIDNFGNAAFIWVVAGLGSVALAANNINLTVNYIGIVPVLGIGAGCSILCGNAIGENSHSKIPRIIMVSMAIELSYIIIITYFQIATPGALLSPFGLADKDNEIRSASIATARVLWMYSLAFSLSMTGSAILQSFGLTKFLFITRLVVMWFVSIPIIYAITSTHHGDPYILPVCWIVGSLFEATIGILYFFRVFSAIRKRQNYIVQTYAKSTS